MKPPLAAEATNKEQQMSCICDEAVFPAYISEDLQMALAAPQIMAAFCGWLKRAFGHHESEGKHEND